MIFYICGGGLAGIRAGELLEPLAGAAACFVGSSGGALITAALARNDVNGLLQALQCAGWPNCCSSRLQSVLENWLGVDATFKDESFVVVAYDCEKGIPVLFSRSCSPELSVAKALTAAATWPLMSPSGVCIDDRVYCDAEFVMSPLLLHAFLRPKPLVTIRGTSRSFADACAPHPGLAWACRIAELHSRFMDDLAASCKELLIRIPGPHPFALVTTTTALKCSVMPLLRFNAAVWTLVALLLVDHTIILTIGCRKVHSRPPCLAPSCPTGNSSQSERRGIVCLALARKEARGKGGATWDEAPRKRRRRRRNRKAVAVSSFANIST